MRGWSPTLLSSPAVEGDYPDAHTIMTLVFGRQRHATRAESIRLFMPSPVPIPELFRAGSSAMGFGR